MLAAEPHHPRWSASSPSSAARSDRGVKTLARMPPPSAAPQSNLLRGVIAPLPETARGTASQLDAHEGRGELLYCNGRAVVRRSLVDPYLSEAIHVHTVGAAVARFAPSGEWIASGDASGLVKVWASGAPLAAAPPSSWGPDDHFVKNEAPALGGKISDVRWSPDGTKVACCGDGRGALAKCFAWDGMKTFGEFDGLSKRVNALDYRPAAGGAGAIVTGGEDCSINLFRGPPFKFDRSIKEHASFVSAVRWSPDGARFATASSDRRCLIHGPDGGAPLLELKGHEGSLFGCVWSPDGQQILTCSADRTCRLWDATTGQVVCSVPCGASDDPKRFQDQQVGVAWVADFPVSLSLSAELNMLDLRAGSVRTRVNGHAKTVTHLAASDGKTFTASYDGRACAWDASEAGGGAGKAGGLASATLHAIGLAATKAGDQVVTAGFDDALALSAVGGDGGMRVLETLPLEAQPKAVAISEAGAFTAVAMAREVRLFTRAAKGHALSCALPLDFDATAVACHPDGTEVAVGGRGGEVVVFDMEKKERRITNNIIYVDLLSYSTCFASTFSSIVAVVFDHGTIAWASQAGGIRAMRGAREMTMVSKDMPHGLERLAFVDGKIAAKDRDGDIVELYDIPSPLHVRCGVPRNVSTPPIALFDYGGGLGSALIGAVRGHLRVVFYFYVDIDPAACRAAQAVHAHFFGKVARGIGVPPKVSMYLTADVESSAFRVANVTLQREIKQTFPGVKIFKSGTPSCNKVATVCGDVKKDGENPTVPCEYDGFVSSVLEGESGVCVFECTRHMSLANKRYMDTELYRVEHQILSLENVSCQRRERCIWAFTHGVDAREKIEIIMRKPGKYQQAIQFTEDGKEMLASLAGKGRGGKDRERKVQPRKEGKKGGEIIAQTKTSNANTAEYLTIEGKEASFSLEETARMLCACHRCSQCECLEGLFNIGLTDSEIDGLLGRCMSCQMWAEICQSVVMHWKAREEEAEAKRKEGEKRQRNERAEMRGLRKRFK